MKHFSIWTATLAATTCLTTAAWAQHGGGAGVSGGGGHDGPHQFAANGSHSSPKTSTSGPAGTTNFESRLASNPNLSSRLQSLLPPGASVQSAAAGFKNEGQFIAALHVSHNLNLPFSQLKSEMTGTNHNSLGKAIRDLRPDLGPKTVKGTVKTAEHQAKTDIGHASQ